jgi:Ca-activated chloride channel homolog
MSTKPIYISIIAVLVIGLTVTVTILLTNHFSKKDNPNNINNTHPGTEPSINSTGTAEEGFAFDNDTTFDSPVGNTLKMTVESNNNYLISSKEINDLYVRLKFDAIKYNVEKRIPLNVSLVIDRSGSMSGKMGNPTDYNRSATGDDIKLEAAKKSVIAFIESMHPEDYISIVAYDTEVEVIMEQVLIGDNINKLKELVSALYSTGSTFLEGGLKEGIRQVESKKSDDYINRVILFSDGVAGPGIATPEGLGDIAKEGVKQGISVSTMGFGYDYDEKVMSAIAINGAGNYQYLKTAESINKALSNELSQLKSIVASRAKVSIMHDPLINFIETYGYSYSSKMVNGLNYVEIPIRDFFSEDTGKILLHFNTTDVKNIKDYNIRIDLTYNDVIKDNEAFTYKSGVTLSVTNNQSIYNASINTSIMSEISKIESTIEMEKANVVFEKGNKEEAINIYDKTINRLKGIIDEFGESEEVTEQIKFMSKQRNELESIKDNYSNKAKDYLKTNRAYNFNTQQGRSTD